MSFGSLPVHDAIRPNHTEFQAVFSFFLNGRISFVPESFSDPRDGRSSTPESSPCFLAASPVTLCRCLTRLCSSRMTSASQKPNPRSPPVGFRTSSLPTNLSTSRGPIGGVRRFADWLPSIEHSCVGERTDTLPRPSIEYVSLSKIVVR
jgi:hypothetical protein